MLREDPAGEHPTSDLLERFLLDRTEPPERRVIVRHLIRGCPTCLAVTRGLWALGDPQEPAGSHAGSGAGDLAGLGDFGDLGDAGIDLWEDLDGPEEPFFLVPGDATPTADAVEALPLPPWPEALERVERAEARELLLALEAVPRPERLTRVRADRRYRTRGFCLRLIEGSRAVSCDQAGPAAATELGELAVAVSERLDRRVYGAPAVHSAQIQAWAWYGEARRRAGDLEGAERSLAMAAHLLEQGLEDLRLGAEVLRLQAALRADLGETDEAHRLLDQAAAVYESLRDDRLRGRVLLQEGEICRVAGEDAAAVDGFQEGARLLAAPEPDDHAALEHGLYHLVWLLVEAGRGDEAAPAARRLRGLWEEAHDAPGLARLRRLEGRIEELAGRPESAEAAFREARQACLDEDLGIEAALALFDLALLLIRQGRMDAFRDLASELHPHFKARGIGQGEATALHLLRQYCDSGDPRPGLLAEVARYIASALAPRPRREAARTAGDRAAV